LRQQSLRLGFKVLQVDSICLQQQRVSSSQIRHYLHQGQITHVQAMLNRPYSIVGRVIRGQQLARTIGVPTANVLLKTQLTAISGVWAVRVELANGQRYLGIANVGERPTVNCIKPLLEVHIFDFSADIYGQLISTEFVEKLREIEKFASFALLTAQIQQDIQQAKTVFNL
jgi:riboflavin kinase / FMN adenylyltransferase